MFDLARREVHYRTQDSPEVKRVALGRFDLSCEAPLLMLDVNADLEGDVAGHFTPYDPDANLKLFREFCDRWDIDVSKEDAEGLMRFFESFECAKLER